MPQNNLNPGPDAAPRSCIPAKPHPVTSLLTVTDQFSARYGKQLSVLMLVLLHLAAMRGGADPWARGFMLAHFGMFILWQPFLQGNLRLGFSAAAAIFGAAALILLGLNWWLLALWVAMLAGIVGGKVFVFQQRWIRTFYLLVLAYLVALLLLWIVPRGLSSTFLEPILQPMAMWGLPALFVVMLALRIESSEAEPQIVDLFYSMLIFLLLVGLVLGSFAFMTIGQINYGLSVSYSVLTLGAMLMALGLLWNPRAGFAGLSVFFSRYLLSVGLPLEQWLHFLAELSRSENQPQQFLRKAAQGLSKLQWVSGGVWHTPDESGEFGQKTEHSIDFRSADFELRIFSRWRPSPALAWHFNVLGHLLAQFYIAKQREVKLREQSYVQAVHETGARLTHDVKNLLQSLNVLCSAAEQENSDSAAFHAMVRRHLPAVTQRLQRTMEKLQRPTLETGRFMRPDVWWEQVQRTFQHPAVRFEANIESTTALLPRDLFESAADNLINNALEKRRIDSSVQVVVRLECGSTMRFSVTDTGKPVRPEIARGLFLGPVPSDTGYGIALYQIYRQAEAHGFGLQLTANEPGNVCFELAPRDG